ncbi:queuosine precursor transporter [Borrelia miyamotoi]|uniref:Probable queuosine precursor transporter n=1 Tax=Borrelia miyamotoi TaxID=47466 RepID=A0AAX3JMM6_9SPIR|nr:queuosine precursor transporter [Borrelia miyamotoi]QFP42243.1 queuosine precursor transporter [Borrelia miyamotoi]QFP48357.1 queuosine precursor transporter [Borrelia miyamotoi]QGT56117.1 queuosine precursor transporter [Borrelia miyamotoi]QGT56897.1 queuosine precursor transporter [Borrelia miyamotoi]WAZ72162.1 queuosine precursor transporter [Borrelia miyamotoi]
MSNEILWCTLLICIYSILIIIYKLFGRKGLFAWVTSSVIIANIQVLKQITIFGFNTTLGNIIYASSYVATDILSELYGREISKKAIYIGFMSFISFAFITNIQLYFSTNNSDIYLKSLESIFSSIPILLLASIIAYIMSQLNDIYLYDLIKNKFPKFLFIRSNGSTLVSELMDTIIFVNIATYFNVFPQEAYLDIVISTYIIKGFAGILGTPFIYIAKYISQNKKI